MTKAEHVDIGLDFFAREGICQPRVGLAVDRLDLLSALSSRASDAIVLALLIRDSALVADEILDAADVTRTDDAMKTGQ